MRFFSYFLAGICLLFGPAPTAVGQVLDPNFAPSTLTAPANGVLTALKQPDGKVLIGGYYFQLMNGQPAPMVSRLNADGSPDLVFRARAGSGPNNTVAAIGLQPDGKILLGGEFGLTAYNGVPISNLIRLNADGSLDASFGAGGAGWQGGGIYSIVVQPDGNILVGGSLTATFNGQATNGLVRLLPTGRPDASFTPGTGFGNTTGGDGQVRKLLLQPDGRIIATGLFTSIGGHVSYGVARLLASGNADASFTSGLRFSAFGLDMVRQPDGKLVVGGNALLSSLTNSYLTRLLPDGTLDPTFTPSQPTGTVFGLGLRADGSLLVSGGFSSFGSHACEGLVRLLPSGAFDPAFTTATGSGNTIMKALELDNGQYLAVGFISEFGGRACTGVARLQANGAADASYSLALGYVASGSLAPLQNGQLLLNSTGLATFNGQAVSNMLSPFGQTYPSFHRISATGNYLALATLPPGNPRTNGDNYLYNAFPQPDGMFYATYQNTDSTALVRHVLANGTFDPAFAAAVLQWDYSFAYQGANNIVVQPGGGLLLSGSFSRVNNQPRKSVVRLRADGTLNTQFAPPANAVWQVPTVGIGNTAGFRYAVGLPNGQTLVVWNDASRSHVARLNLDGTVDNTFSIGSGGGPSALFGIVPLANGNVLAIGDFTTFNGQAAPYGLLRLLPSGAPDPAFTAASAATTLIEQSDGKLLLLAPGATSQTERLVRLTTTGSLDAGFQPVVVGNESFSPVAAGIYLQPGTNAIVLSGNFTSVAGQPRVGLARLVNTALGVRGAAEPLAEAFPNPAHDQLQLRLPAPATGPITLLDLQGRVVRRWPAVRAAGSVSVAGLAAGVYVLGIPTAAGQRWQRISVE